MTLSFITFVSIFLFVFFTIGFIVLLINNIIVLKNIAKLNLQISKLTKITYKDIKISHSITSGAKEYISIFNTADIYIFQDFIVILRVQNFILKYYFNPIIISQNPVNTKEQFRHLSIFKPDKIFFYRGNEFKIDTNDPNYKNRKIKYQFKKLTDEQFEKLSRVKSWVE